MRALAQIVLAPGSMMNMSSVTPRLGSMELARLRRKLEQKREALLASQRDALDWARGISDHAIEDVDVAERMIEQQTALRQGAIDGCLLAEVERALRKIEGGRYGFSEDSGLPIALERLDAIPWARRTETEEHRHMVSWGIARDAR
jgi:DnaK suppressor protein